jgi:hypothetical protein
MDGFVGINVAPRKEWSAPELKKVCVEQITALSHGSGGDGGGSGHNKS